MKYLIPIFLQLIFINQTFAVESQFLIKDCGRYHIRGIIRKDPKSSVLLVVNEKTKSEYRFKPKDGELHKFVGIIDSEIKLDVQIVSLDGTAGVVAYPSNIDREVPDPLNTNHKLSFELMEKKKCEKYK